MNFEIATGVAEHTINGTAKIRFSPTDPDFADRLIGTFEEIGKASEQLADGTTFQETMQKTRELDKAAREKIDALLGEGVCDQAFKNISLLALADGLPLWANLLLAIIDEMDDAIAREKKESSARIKKYTEKFKNR